MKALMAAAKDWQQRGYKHSKITDYEWGIARAVAELRNHSRDDVESFISANPPPPGFGAGAWYRRCHQ